MRILVFEHDSDAPAALLVAWADSRDHELEVVAGRRPECWPAIDDFDAIVSLGSEQSAMQSDVPWVAREIELLRGHTTAGSRSWGSASAGRCWPRHSGELCRAHRVAR